LQETKNKRRDKLQVHANVTFIKKRITAFDKLTSRYRGKWKLLIDEFYITIQGRRLYSLIPRITLGLIVFLLSRSFIIKFIHIVFHLQFDKPITMTEGIMNILLMILSCYLVENVILIKEDFTIQLIDINKFTAYPENELVAISIKELARCSPMMFRCKNWAEIIQILKMEIPEKYFSLKPDERDTIELTPQKSSSTHNKKTKENINENKQ
jgi:hypothetical protein